MSVILYEDEKFLKVYESLQEYRPLSVQCDWGGRYFASLFGYPEGWDKPDVMDAHLRAFVQDLRRANTACWNNQYPDDVQPIDILEFPEPPAAATMPYANNFELLLSLRGLRYNCIDNGGREYSLNSSFEKLEDILEEIAMDIIDSLPQMQEAQTW